MEDPNVLNELRSKYPDRGRPIQDRVIKEDPEVTTLQHIAIQPNQMYSTAVA